MDRHIVADHRYGVQMDGDLAAATSRHSRRNQFLFRITRHRGG